MGSTRDKYARVLGYFIDHKRITTPEVSAALNIDRHCVREWLKALVEGGLAAEVVPHSLLPGIGRGGRHHGNNTPAGMQPAVYEWKGF